MTLEAFNSGQVAYLTKVASLLRPGDVVDLGKSSSNHTPDIATLNAWAQELSPRLPSGVMLTVRVESLASVKVAARSLSPLFQGIMVDYEPSPIFFPTWTWNFTTALGYYGEATAICHEYHRLSFAYPSGRPLLEGDLQPYHWSYGALAKVVDFVDVEAQSDAGHSKWPAAISKLVAQFANASVPLGLLTVQLSLGSGGNGVSESAALGDARYAVNRSVESLYLWSSMSTESWLVPLVTAVENLTNSSGPPPESRVTFTESGLPTGTPWWVNVTGGPSVLGQGTNLSIAEPNGSYSYSVRSANRSFASLDGAGQFAVQGRNLSVTVEFSFSPSESRVTFYEVGLPGGSAWRVNVTGGSSVASTGPSLGFSEPNGTYRYLVQSANRAFSPDPARGQLLATGTPVSVVVDFSRVNYSVRFVAQGLAVGTSFTIVVNGTRLTSSSGPVVVPEANGSYRYTVGRVPGYSLNGGSQGEVVVLGRSVTVDLLFTAVPPDSSPTIGLTGGFPPPFAPLLFVTTAAGALLAGVAWGVYRRRRRAPPLGSAIPCETPGSFP